MFSRAKDPLHHTVAIKDEELFWKKILIVDDEADVTLTFQAGIEEINNHVSKRSCDRNDVAE